MKDRKNFNKDFEKILRPFIERLKQKTEVEGIVVLGGLGQRSYVDLHSDIDVAIFFSTKTASLEWLPNFEFSVHLSEPFNKNLAKLDFNVHQQELHQQQSEQWNQIKKDAYSNGVIAYDRSGKVTKLIKQKTKYNRASETEILLIAISKLPPYIRINPKKQAQRGLFLVAHQLLNEGIDIIVEALFVLNQRFLPHDKWKLREVLSLTWLPSNFEHDLREGLLVKNFSLRDVDRRQVALGRVADQISLKIVERLGDSELGLYGRACRTTLQRQYVKETFADKLLKKVEDLEKGIFTNLERKRVFGFINYTLIKNMSEFKCAVNSFKEKDIEGLLECKKILELLKK